MNARKRKRNQVDANELATLVNKIATPTFSQAGETRVKRVELEGRGRLSVYNFAPMIETRVDFDRGIALVDNIPFLEFRTHADDTVIQYNIPRYTDAPFSDRQIRLTQQADAIQLCHTAGGKSAPYSNGFRLEMASHSDLYTIVEDVQSSW